MSPKLGRPTDNPKPYKVSVRLDEQSKTILHDYCQQESVEQGEAIRRGVKKLAEDLKESE